ncbi:hypothetical protein Acr_27g0006670 [Actinidia rufa]|uniref:non-specific serine/threonine protein kinase n=1 Tax=Actinidia rufa TaxID=165716 RepID=A0A7J0H7D0_9ERIC|nr:hypothetical protein Acr_27g0006670 [Actinidia rufa]
MRYANCSESFNCGNIRTVQYPFWGVNRADYCGLPNFELECEDEVPKITIVLVKFPNTTLDFDLFNYHSDIWNVTLFYGCTYFRGPTIGFLGQYNCTDNSVGVDASVYYVTWSSSNVDDLYTGSCNSSVVVSVLKSAARGLEANTTTIGAAVDGGFELYWVPGNDQCITCLESGGVCGHNRTENQFICFCYDHPSIDSCPSRPPVREHSRHRLSFLGRDEARELWPPEFRAKLPRRGPQNHYPVENIPSPFNRWHNTKTLTVVRDEFWHDTCPTALQNATLDTTHFSYASNARNVTLYYGCPSLASQTVLRSLNMLCSGKETNTASFYLTSGTAFGINFNVEACTSIVIVQINQTAAEALAMASPLMAIGQALDGGFGLHWEANKDKCDRCVESGGVCGSKSGSKFACYCSDQSYPLTCNSTRDGSGMFPITFLLV